MSGLVSVTAAHVDRIVACVGRIFAGLVPKAEPLTGAAARALLADALLADHDAAAAIGGHLPDVVLAQRFGLDDTDLALLWFVVAPHLEPSLHEAIARANDDVRHDQLDLALVLRALTDDRVEQMALLGDLGPGGRLVERGLLEIVPRERGKTNRLFASLVPGDHVVSFLAGVRAVSPASLPYCDWMTPRVTLDALHVPTSFRREVVPVVSAFMRRASLREGWLGPAGLRAFAGVGLVLRGPDGSGRATAVRALAGTLGRAVLQVDGRLLALASPEEQRACIRSVLREGELFGDIVCVRDADKLVAPDASLAPLIARELERRAVVCCLCTSGEALDATLERAVLVKHTFTATLSREQAALTWMLGFPSGRARLSDATFESLVERTSLTPQQMRKASQLAYLATEDVVREERGLTALVSGETLERAAKAQVSRQIGGLATVSDPRLRLQDLVLDATTAQRIDEIIAAAKNRRVVLEEWGLGARIHRGTGLVALFDGEPGTGKTHAAEVIASELGLSLVHVNVASVVDKYIGETEKNLQRIFDEARPDISLLLFDEADSLFSKRTTSVEKATDRYSNMDINVMLQLIERYPGVAVLTTNLKKAIDPAFERRFSFKVHFELPQAPERERIWRYLVPEHVPTEGPIDWRQVASVELSGGEIKNALLSASYQAMLHGARLDTRRLCDAATREAAAMGRLVRRAAD